MNQARRAKSEAKAEVLSPWRRRQLAAGETTLAVSSSSASKEQRYLAALRVLDFFEAFFRERVELPVRVSRQKRKLSLLVDNIPVHLIARPRGCLAVAFGMAWEDEPEEVRGLKFNADLAQWESDKPIFGEVDPHRRALARVLSALQDAHMKAKGRGWGYSASIPRSPPTTSSEAVRSPFRSYWDPK